MKKDRSKANGSAVLKDQRCSTGIEGLDDILSGGLPRDCFYLIQGDPGSGKTTLALQFLLEGVRCGERVFYVTLSETRRELTKVTRSHGWSLDSIPLLEISAIEQLLRPEAQTTVFHPSEVDLNKVSKLLMDEVSKTRPARIVFDSLSEFRLLAETALRYRRELLNLKQHFAECGSTVLELDDLFGGGLDRGTATLILGAAGTGKSTFALQYVKRMALKGEPGLIYAFDEARAILLGRAKALGLDLEEHVESGVVTVQQVDPAELSPGEFVTRIRKQVDGGCKLVVIDSLNGYLYAMPGEKYLNNQLHELVSYLNHKGVVTILILAQHGLLAAAEAPVDLSYLSDTVVSLRYFEAAGEVKQSVAVVKKRSGPHEKTIREFKLERGQGVRLGQPLREFQGVLSGMPVFRGAAEEIMSATDGKE